MNRSQRARRKARRLNARRKRRRRSLPENWFSFERVFSFENLMDASRRCQRNCLWKQSAAEFCRRRAVNCTQLRASLADGTFHPMPPIRFTLVERGKLRKISGPRFRDRVVQRCIMDAFLTRLVVPTLTHGNSASVEGRGTSYAKRLAARDMVSMLNRYGPEVAVARWDVSNYFGSVPSGRAFAYLVDLVSRYTASRCEEDEAWRIMQVASLYIESEPHLTLGNPLNQLAAVAYLSPLDHALQEVDRPGPSSRFMDDGLIACPDARTARRALLRVGRALRRYGLKPNPKGMRTSSPAISSVTFLKTRYRYGSRYGKLSVERSRATLARLERHIADIADAVAAGTLDIDVLDSVLRATAGLRTETSTAYPQVPA